METKLTVGEFESAADAIWTAYTSAKGLVLARDRQLRNPSILLHEEYATNAERLDSWLHRARSQWPRIANLIRLRCIGSPAHFDALRFASFVHRRMHDAVDPPPDESPIHPDREHEPERFRRLAAVILPVMQATKRPDFDGLEERIQTERLQARQLLPLDSPVWSRPLPVLQWRIFAYRGLGAEGEAMPLTTWQRKKEAWKIPEREGSTTRIKSFDLRYVPWLTDDEKSELREPSATK